MAWVTRLRLHHRGLLSGMVFTVAAATLVVLAVTAKGQPATQVKLNDGGVWVTATNSKQLAQYLPQVHQPGAATTEPSESYDLLQDGAQVLWVDNAGGVVQQFDPATAQPAGATVKTGSDQIALGGLVGAAVVAIWDSKGQVWVLPFDAVSGLDLSTARPVATAGPGAQAAVGIDGTVFVTSPARHSLITIAAGGAGAMESALPGASDGPADALTVTAVGSDPVVLDATHQQLLVRGHMISLQAAGAKAVLQQPSASADTVLVATPTGLMQVPLAGGDPEQVGDPVPASSPELTAPVRVNGCSYGAFINGLKVFQVRGGDPQKCLPGNVELGLGNDGYTPQRLVYRVNRNLLALNDPATGAIWDPTDKNPERLDNWPKTDQDHSNDHDRSNDKIEGPKCRSGDDAPVTKPDKVGARRGIPVVIAVLANDTDRNCDVLALTGVPTVEPKGAGTVGLVGDGRLVQFTPDVGYNGSTVHLKYVVSDGKSTTPGNATVDIKEGNDPPELLLDRQHPHTVVVQNKSVSYNVLGSFKDPDGDPLQLIGADIDPAQGSVSFTPDGLVTYQNSGRVGTVSVAVTVSDGRDSTPDKLLIDVKPSSATLNPVAADDYEHTAVNVPLTFNPLANDSDPRQNPIQLARVDDSTPRGLSVQIAEDSVTVEASKPGTYVLSYLIKAGPGSATGTIRVDVTEAKENQPPTAMVDIASVESGRETSIDVLANDADPDQDVLAVTDVDVDDDTTGITATVVHQDTVIISTDDDLSAPVTLTYLVTDGRNEPVRGTVVAAPLEKHSEPQAPLAQDDRVRVRAGALVTIPVLDNDMAEPGHRLELSSELATPPDSGRALINGDEIRYVAGSETGTDSFSYTVRDMDAAGASSTAVVSVSIVPTDDESLPVPPVLQARVRQGETTEIEVPTSGTDPDGTPTVVSGALTSTFQNTATATGNTINYRADGELRGTDTVTYQLCPVLAGLGCATGTIRVGVFPTSDVINQPPVTHPYDLTMRPGDKYPISIAAFVTDADDDPISLSNDADHQVTSIKPMAARALAPDSIELTAPKEPGTYGVSYWVNDAVHESDPVQGTVTVTVDPDASPAAPVARDDVVAADQASGGTVKVDVLANDTDPDGSKLHPEPLPDSGGAKVVGDQIEVPLTGKPQVVGYRAVDENGNAGTAFILVLGQDAPRLKDSPRPLSVAVHGSVSFDLSEEIVDPDNGPKSLSVTSASDVTAQPTSDNAGRMISNKTITYQPTAPPSSGDVGYVTVQVTDGENTVSIAIPVKISGEDPPIAVQSPSYTVEQGEQKNISLVGLVTGAGSSPLIFQAVGDTGVSAVQVRIDRGGEAILQAAPDAAGLTARQHFTVQRGSDPPIKALLVIHVVKTTQPKVDAIAIPVHELDLGQTTRIELIGKLQDPFAGRATSGLQLVSVETLTGGVDAAPDGTGVKLTGTSAGPAVVEYRVQDVAGRIAIGHINVVVWGPPSRPGTPTMVRVDATWVVLTWTPSESNMFVRDKKAHDFYYVVSATGMSPQNCNHEVCKLTNLKTGYPYIFTVKAVNSVSSSEESEPSARITPNVKPAAPQFQTITPERDSFGDGYVKLKWRQPDSGGTSITNYTLTVNPPVDTDLSVRPTDTTKTVTNLTNGIPYTFTLVASNQQGDSDAAEIDETPTAAPGQVDNLTATPVQDSVGKRIDASWSAASNGGDPAMTYKVELLQGSDVVDTQAQVADTTAHFSVTNGIEYKVRVTAVNRKGAGDPAFSTVVKAVGQPGPVTNLAAKGTGSDRVLELSWDDPKDLGGAQPDELTFDYNVDGTWQPLNGKTTINVPQNGTPYNVQVRVWNGNPQPSDVASYTLNPAEYAYGNPSPPTVNASASGTTITFTWNAPAENGLAVQVTYSIDGAAGQSGNPIGSVSKSYGYSEKHTIVVQSCLKEHPTACSSSSPTGATTVSPPAQIIVEKGAPHTISTCTSSLCAYVKVTLKNFPANRTFHYTMDDTISHGWPDYNRTITTNASGGGSDTYYVYGYSGGKVIIKISGYPDGVSAPW